VLFTDFGGFASSKCNVVHCFFIGHYMFRPDWPSSGVQVKDSPAHCNAAFIPPVVVSCGYQYFGYVGCTWFTDFLLGCDLLLLSL
jgi:hypothetical protein